MIRNIITVVVAIVTFVVGIKANQYYNKKSEERIIAALKDELDQLKKGRLIPGSQERINEIEAILKYKYNATT